MYNTTIPVFRPFVRSIAEEWFEIIHYESVKEN